MKKVLIIDDDAAILEAMQLALEDEGYVVNTITNGNHVLSACQKFQPNIILLDLLLSGKSGTEIIDTLKQDKATSNIPVILSSAHPTASQTAKEIGATDFLAKPFDVEELLMKVKTRILNTKDE